MPTIVNSGLTFFFSHVVYFSNLELEISKWTKEGTLSSLSRKLGPFGIVSRHDALHPASCVWVRGPWALCELTRSQTS